MPRQNWGLDRNINRLPLPDKLPAATSCVRVFVPDDQYYRNLLVGALNRLAKQIWYERDDAHTAKQVAALWYAANRMTFENFSTPCEPAQEGGADGVGGASGGTYEDLIEIMKELEMKFSIDGKIYEPVIPLQECGCGDSSTGSGNFQDNGGVVDGSTPGGVIGGGTPTLCDVLTSGVDWILNQVDNMVGDIQSVTFVADLIPWLDEVVALGYIDDVNAAATDIENELQDPDFRVVLEDAIGRWFPDPITMKIDRYKLWQFGYEIPVIFEGAPMRSAFLLWGITQNIQVFNNMLKSWAGTGDYGGICAQVGERVGRTMYNPLDVAPEGGIVSKKLVNQGALNDFRITMLKTPFSFSAVSNTTLPITFDEDRNIFGGGWNLINSGLSNSKVSIDIAPSNEIVRASAAQEALANTDFIAWGSARSLTTAQTNEIIAEVEAYLGWTPVADGGEITASRSYTAGEELVWRHFQTGTGEAEISGLFLLSQSV